VLALNDDGSYRENVFYQHIGEAYIPIAFEAAAAADPDVKLYYNDYSIEYDGGKANAAENIVKLVQSYGAKIDGVGLQGHFTVGQTPSKKDLASTLKSYTALGVEVAYTEMDVRMEMPSSSDKLSQQSTDYASLVGACVETEGCVGITIWDWTDKYSWVPDTFSGYGDACPWDENYEKKQAYDGILNALGGSSSARKSRKSKLRLVCNLTHANDITQCAGTRLSEITEIFPSISMDFSFLAVTVECIFCIHSSGISRYF